MRLWSKSIAKFIMNLKGEPISESSLKLHGNTHWSLFNLSVHNSFCQIKENKPKCLLLYIIKELIYLVNCFIYSLLSFLLLLLLLSCESSNPYEVCRQRFSIKMAILLRGKSWSIQNLKWYPYWTWLMILKEFFCTDVKFGCQHFISIA